MAVPIFACRLRQDQGWEFGQGIQPEMLQEIRRSAIQNGAARAFCPPDLLDKALAEQGFHHTVAADTPHSFNIWTRDRLLVGNNRQCLQRRPA